MSKPIVNETNETGRLAVTLLQLVFERKSWIFRRQDGDSDFGVDGELEVVDCKQATGALIKCQIKGTNRLDWEGGYETVRVKVSTYNSWKDCQLPVVVFLVDISNENIFWMSPSWQTPKYDANSIYLKFLKENKLDKSLDGIRLHLEAWNNLFSSSSCLMEIPIFDSFLQELNGQISGAEYAPMEIESDLEGKLKLFYKHALQLRIQASLPIKKIVTFEEWFIRNSGIWNSEKITYGTAAEMLAYIKPYYDEAIEKVKILVETYDGSIRTQDAKNFLLGDNTFYSDTREQDPSFHREIEERIDKQIKVHFRYADKKK